MDPLLFLDFDGVLHDDPVFLRDGQPWLDPEYGTLFQWAPQLAAVLADFPQVHVILSTSWVQRLGYRDTLARMPASLAEHVIDCVRHQGDYLVSGYTNRRFDAASRYEQIHQYVKRVGAVKWVAIDNDARDWPRAERHHLVKTGDYTGIGDPAAQQELREKLTSLVAAAGLYREQT